MIAVRKAEERGRTRLGWLDSRHSFSFGEYHDPRQMGFRALRVVNDDRVAPGQGFPTHGHRDMEILSVVLDGALEHRDSLGTGSVIRPGEVQRMTAGKGVRHSEYNPSPTEPVRFLQIWILPERAGLEPAYEQRAFPLDERRGRLRLVAARDGRDGALTLHQDADLYVTTLAAGERITHGLGPARHAWLQVARGALSLDGIALTEGDGAAVSDRREMTVAADGPAEVLLIDLA